MSSRALILGPSAVLFGPRQGDGGHDAQRAPAGCILLSLAAEPARRTVSEPVTAEDRVIGVLKLGDDTAAITLPTPVEAWASISPPLDLVEALKAATGVDVSSLGPDYGPIGLLRRHDDGTADILVPSISGASSSTLYVRIAEYGASGSDELDATAALSRIQTLRHSVLDDLWHYRKFEAGTEIEQKITVFGDTTAWQTTVELYRAFTSSATGPYRLEYGDELQRCQRSNLLYEVLGPTEQRGYISFIPAPTGAVSVKRKIFGEDALRRLEHVQRGVDLGGLTPRAWLKQNESALQTRLLGAFERTRFDLNIECVDTGHVFSVMSDESTVRTMPSEVLRQLEIEYVRTRVHDQMDPSTIDDELADLTSFVISVLKANSAQFEETFYSKLSFLRDVRQRAGGQIVDEDYADGWLSEVTAYA